MISSHRFLRQTAAGVHDEVLAIGDDECGSLCAIRYGRGNPVPSRTRWRSAAGAVADVSDFGVPCCAFPVAEAASQRTSTAAASRRIPRPPDALRVVELYSSAVRFLTTRREGSYSD